MWNIRPAEELDLHAVLDLWQAVGMGGIELDEWNAIVGGGCTTLFVAEEGGALVGTGVAAFDGWRAYVYHVAVAPEVQGRGLGRALMAEAERHLSRRGARRIYALVNESNTTGIALCASSGYEPEGDVAFVKEVSPPASLAATEAIRVAYR